MSRGAIGGAALLVLGALGCGDDGAPAVDAFVPTDAGARPTVRVTVTSDAEGFEGTVRVGAFVENPPTTPPVALDNLASPTFPATGELLDVPAGEYHVLVILDFDPPNPTIPGPEDVIAETGPITVGGEDLEVTVDLPVP